MNIDAFSERLKQAALRSGFTLAHYGKVGDTGLPVLERRCGDAAPEVYISTGVHGDEPAGPMALLDLLQNRSLPDSFNYTLFPMINPDGLRAGTRENAAGIDLNRDYGLQPRSHETRAQLEWIGGRQFSITLCLHEDYDGEGFYLYSHERNHSGDDIAGMAIAAASEWTGVDRRTLIDDMPARDGRMFPPEDVMDMNRPDLPEALRLYFHHGADITVTTETPSGHLIADRIRAQCAAVQAILRACRQRES